MTFIMKPQKQIVILTYGTRGDVQPFVALGIGLRKAGYHVRIAAPACYKDLILPHPLEMIALPGDPEQLAKDLVNHAGLNWARQVRVMTRHILPLAIAVLHAIKDGCEDADIILHSFLMTDAGHMIAAEKGIPDLSAQFFPVFTRTPSFPGVVFPDLPLGPMYRRFTHDLVTLIFRVGGRMLYSHLRRSHPDLPQLTAWPFSARGPSNTPILYAFSSHVIPRPRDWPRTSIITGYWFSDHDPNWHPSKELEGFLSSDPPPLFIGFGSMGYRQGQSIVDLCAQALALIGQRAILAGDAISMDQARLPNHLLFARELPHAWLFPRVLAVVHHGGAGTTGAGLQAGIPNLIVPFTADQGFWGRRIAELGVGSKPIPLRRLTVDRLAEALKIIISDAEMRARAYALGEKIRQEDGVGNAIEAIRAHID